MEDLNDFEVGDTFEEMVAPLLRGLQGAKSAVSNVETVIDALMATGVGMSVVSRYRIYAKYWKNPSIRLEEHETLNLLELVDGLKEPDEKTVRAFTRHWVRVASFRMYQKMGGIDEMKLEIEFND